MRKTLLLPVLLVVAALSCNRSSEEEYAPAEISDLAALMADYNNIDTASRLAFIDSCRPEAVAFFKAIAEEDTLDDALASAWSASLAVAVFTPAADSVFPTLDPLREQLGHILGEAADEGLELPRRRYAAVVYGRPEAVLFVDSVALIALNHFLGAEYPGYSRWPAYRRLEKEPANLPYYLAEALVAQAYPYQAEGSDATLMSHLLYQGALAKAKLAIVPRAEVRGVLEYNAEDFAWIEENKDRLWAELVASGLLFDTSESTAARFVAPSPAVRDLPSIYPGRIGRYVGLKLVEDYLRNNPDATLSFLLSPGFYTAQHQLTP